MRRPINKRRQQIVSEEAAHWFILVSDDPSALYLEQRREFFAWLRQSPENVAEILRLLRLSRRMRHVQLIVHAVHLLDANVIPFPNQPTTHPISTAAAVSSPEPHRSRRVPVGLARVAAVILVCIALLCASSDTAVVRDPDAIPPFMVATGLKQVEHLTLPDGSGVHLGPESKIRVAFSGKRRWIYLLGGEAVFEVAKDAARPFTVRTQWIDATAVGTRFGVRIGHGVTTTVSEGVVNVRERSSELNGVDVIAGQELRFRDGTGANVNAVDAVRALAWSVGWVIVGGETIAEGAAAFNRFNTVQVVVSKEVATRRLLFFRFLLNQPETFAKAVAESPDVRLIVERDGSVLRLVPRQ